MLTKKVPLIVGWLGGFAIQAFVRHWIWDVSLFSALGAMTGIAFVLFTNYMITDPAPRRPRPATSSCSAPRSPWSTACMMLFNVVYTLFFATTVVCALRGLGWWVAHFIAKAKQRRAPAADRPIDSNPAAVAA